MRDVRCRMQDDVSPAVSWVGTITAVFQLPLGGFCNTIWLDTIHVSFRYKQFMYKVLVTRGTLRIGQAIASGFENTWSLQM